MADALRAQQVLQTGLVERAEARLVDHGLAVQGAACLDEIVAVFAADQEPPQGPRPADALALALQAMDVR